MLGGTLGPFVRRTIGIAIGGADSPVLAPMAPVRPPAALYRDALTRKGVHCGAEDREHRVRSDVRIIDVGVMDVRIIDGRKIMNTKREMKKVMQAADWDPMKKLSDAGVRSSHAYTAGLVVLGLSIVTSLFMSSDSRRARIAAVLAPTLFTLGLGLKHEE